MSHLRVHTSCALRRRSLLLLVSIYFCANGLGCSVWMAAKAPHKKDLSVLAPGVARSVIVAELGPPLQSRQDENGMTDIFAFKQGYAAPTRIGRFTTHLVGDVMTMGLWELAGTPIEASFKGEDVRAEVVYDETEHAKNVEYYAGAHLVDGGPTLAKWARKKSTQQTARLGTPKPNAIIQTGAVKEPTDPN